MKQRPDNLTVLRAKNVVCSGNDARGIKVKVNSLEEHEIQTTVNVLEIWPIEVFLLDVQW